MPCLSLVLSGIHGEVRALGFRFIALDFCLPRITDCSLQGLRETVIVIVRDLSAFADNMLAKTFLDLREHVLNNVPRRRYCQRPLDPPGLCSS